MNCPICFKALFYINSQTSPRTPKGEFCSYILELKQSNSVRKLQTTNRPTVFLLFRAPTVQQCFYISEHQQSNSVPTFQMSVIKILVASANNGVKRKINSKRIGLHLRPICLRFSFEVTCADDVKHVSCTLYLLVRLVTVENHYYHTRYEDRSLLRHSTSGP